MATVLTWEPAGSGPCGQAGGRRTGVHADDRAAGAAGAAVLPAGLWHKMSFTDQAGHRLQVFITNQADRDTGSRWKPTTGACPRRGPHPRRQGDRACQPALPRACRQRRLARLVMIAPDARLLDPGVVSGRRAWRGRAQHAALPVVAYRRAAGPPRPPAHLVPATHLALAVGAGGGVRAGASPARTLLTVHRDCDADLGGEIPPRTDVVVGFACFPSVS
jgi:hypothetical protein